jgi:hypothetical protein
LIEKERKRRKNAFTLCVDCIQLVQPHLELLASEDEALLVRGDALLVLNLRLDVVDGVGGLHLERDGLARERLHKDLHAAAEAEDEVQR